MPRILLVDDETDILEALEFELSRHSYDVTIASSGLAAVAFARQRPFDLVMTDLRMPGMSGAETITALRAIDPAVPIVVVTGYASDETAADCMQRGAAHFIRKPVDLDVFLSLVKTILA